MRVAIADDSALFRGGLAMLLESVGVEVVLQSTNVAELFRGLAHEVPDTVILDIRMPPTFTDEGLVAAQRLRAQHPDLGLLVLSTYAETAYATRLLDAGTKGVGYLLKDRVDDTATLADALTRIARGDCVIDPEIVSRLVVGRRARGVLDSLTERERSVLGLMAEGRSNNGIGQSLFLSPKTVESHVAGVFVKLGLPAAADDNRRVLAVLTWLRAARAAGR